MIWLASFPRSGNTFLRNVLYEVYGIASSTFHREHSYPVDPGYDRYPVVKTHLLPGQLMPVDRGIPAVYLVRDGRDAVVSIAHHRQDVVAPGSDYHQNLQEAILAAHGSFFGGWSENVQQWIKRADLVIRFEDLRQQPVACAERLRAILTMPPPDVARVPTFESLKHGEPQYGSGRKRGKTEKEVRALTAHWFRRGQVGGWKEELPRDLQDLFWSYHRHVMESVGYGYDGRRVDLNPDLDWELISKLGSPPTPAGPRYKVLIEASKLSMIENDGIKRYLTELLKALLPVVENPRSRWTIDLCFGNRILPLSSYRDSLIQTGTVEPKARARFGGGPLQWAKAVSRMVLSPRAHRRVRRWYRRIKSGLQVALGLLRKWNILPPPSTHQQFAQYDLIHVPLMQHLGAFEGVDANYVITVHDLTHLHYPEFHRKRNVELAHQGYESAKRRRAAIIAVSECTQRDLHADHRFDPDRMFLISEGVDNTRFRKNFNAHLARHVRDLYGIPDGPFFLTVSTIEPRKNIRNTLRAFGELIAAHPEQPVHLVIVGPRGWKTKAVLEEPSLKSGRVVLTGFVEDCHLPVLYSDAVALCYISYFEGFGLPVVEAMSCGTPVIYGQNSSLIEVAGAGGLPADPDDIDGIRKQMETLLFDVRQREEKSRLALRQSFRFSWRKTAIETLQAYETLIQQRRARAATETIREGDRSSDPA